MIQKRAESVRKTKRKEIKKRKIVHKFFKSEEMFCKMRKTRKEQIKVSLKGLKKNKR